MRVRPAIVQRILLGLALLAGLAWNLAHASEIKSLRLTQGPTGTRAEIGLDGAGQYQVLRLANPDRLVIDLPSATLAKGLALPAGSGVVQSVRSGQPEAGTTRLVFDLAQPVADALFGHTGACLRRAIERRQRHRRIDDLMPAREA